MTQTTTFYMFDTVDALRLYGAIRARVNADPCKFTAEMDQTAGLLRMRNQPHGADAKVNMDIPMGIGEETAWGEELGFAIVPDYGDYLDRDDADLDIICPEAELRIIIDTPYSARISSRDHAAIVREALEDVGYDGGWAFNEESTGEWFSGAAL